jgi:hypothetical protein
LVKWNVAETAWTWWPATISRTAYAAKDAGLLRLLEHSL